MNNKHQLSIQKDIRYAHLEWLAGRSRGWRGKRRQKRKKCIKLEEPHTKRF